MGKPSDYQNLFEHGFSFSQRVVYLESGSSSGFGGEISEVDSSMASRAIKALSTLESASKMPIEVIINSPGGSMDDGWAIYDKIRSCESEITTTAMGSAMSMGAVILQAGDMRRAHPNSSIMIHYGYSGSGTDRINTAHSSQAFNQLLLKRMKDLFIEKIKEKQPKCGTATIKRWLSEDKFFSVEEALKYGLIDEIVGVE